DGKVVMGADGKPEMVSWPELAARIADVTGQPVDDVTQIVVDALAENPNARWARVKRFVSTETYRELAQLGLPFLTFEAVPSRTYPNGAVAGNVLGFVNADGDPLEGVE